MDAVLQHQIYQALLQQQLLQPQLRQQLLQPQLQPQPQVQLQPPPQPQASYQSFLAQVQQQQQIHAPDLALAVAAAGATAQPGSQEPAASSSAFFSFDSPSFNVPATPAAKSGAADPKAAASALLSSTATGAFFAFESFDAPKEHTPIPLASQPAACPAVPRPVITIAPMAPRPPLPVHPAGTRPANKPEEDMNLEDLEARLSRQKEGTKKTPEKETAKVNVQKTNALVTTATKQRSRSRTQKIDKKRGRRASSSSSVRKRKRSLSAKKKKKEKEKGKEKEKEKEKEKLKEKVKEKVKEKLKEKVKEKVKEKKKRSPTPKVKEKVKEKKKRSPTPKGKHEKEKKKTAKASKDQMKPKFEAGKDGVVAPPPGAPVPPRPDDALWQQSAPPKPAEPSSSVNPILAQFMAQQKVAQEQARKQEELEKQFQAKQEAAERTREEAARAAEEVERAKLEAEVRAIREREEAQVKALREKEDAQLREIREKELAQKRALDEILILKQKEDQLYGEPKEKNKGSEEASQDRRENEEKGKQEKSAKEKRNRSCERDRSRSRSKRKRQSRSSSSHSRSRRKKSRDRDRRERGRNSHERRRSRDKGRRRKSEETGKSPHRSGARRDCSRSKDRKRSRDRYRKSNRSRSREGIFGEEKKVQFKMTSTKDVDHKKGEADRKKTAGSLQELLNRQNNEEPHASVQKQQRVQPSPPPPQAPQEPQSPQMRMVRNMRQQLQQLQQHQVLHPQQLQMLSQLKMLEAQTSIQPQQQVVLEQWQRYLNQYISQQHQQVRQSLSEKESDQRDEKLEEQEQMQQHERLLQREQLLQRQRLQEKQPQELNERQHEDASQSQQREDQDRLDQLARQQLQLQQQLQQQLLLQKELQQQLQQQYQQQEQPHCMDLPVAKSATAAKGSGSLGQKDMPGRVFAAHEEQDGTGFAKAMPGKGGMLAHRGLSAAHGEQDMPALPKAMPSRAFAGKSAGKRPAKANGKDPLAALSPKASQPNLSKGASGEWDSSLLGPKQEIPTDGDPRGPIDQNGDEWRAKRKQTSSGSESIYQSTICNAITAALQDNKGWEDSKSYNRGKREDKNCEFGNDGNWEQPGLSMETWNSFEGEFGAFENGAEKAPIVMKPRAKVGPAKNLQHPAPRMFGPPPMGLPEVDDFLLEEMPMPMPGLFKLGAMPKAKSGNIAPVWNQAEEDDDDEEVEPVEPEEEDEFAPQVPMRAVPKAAPSKCGVGPTPPPWPPPLAGVQEEEDDEDDEGWNENWGWNDDDEEDDEEWQQDDEEFREEDGEHEANEREVISRAPEELTAVQLEQQKEDLKRKANQQALKAAAEWKKQREAQDRKKRQEAKARAQAHAEEEEVDEEARKRRGKGKGRKGKGKHRGRETEGKLTRRRSKFSELGGKRRFDEVPDKFDNDHWEEHRSESGLMLIGEMAPRLIKWNYLVSDDNRRSYAAFLPCPFRKQQCDMFFNNVKNGTNWVQPSGKYGAMPRKTAWLVKKGCTCTYQYGTTSVEAQEFPPWMLELLRHVMPMCGATDKEDWPDSCNLNLYEDGNMSVGWHADDERLFQGKFRDVCIISLSFGQKRTFEMRLNFPENPKEAEVKKIPLGNGDIMTMEGMMQKHYQHRVPREDGLEPRPRINLTWRWVLKHNPMCPAGRSHRM